MWTMAKQQHAPDDLVMDDAASEAASVGGDDPDGAELRDLRKRAAENGLNPEESRKYGELVQRAADARAAKRARRAVAQQSTSSFSSFCQAAAVQLNAVPAAAGAGGSPQL